MERVCLAFLRFSLSAWVGIEIFFVAVILNLRYSELFDRMSKFNHPKVLFPIYYAFEFALLGPALACAAVGLWHSRLRSPRRWAVLAFVVMASVLAVVDYSNVY